MDTNTPSSISEIGWSWRVSPSKMLTKYMSKIQQKLFPFNLGHRYLTNLILSQRGFVHRGFLNIINSMQSSRQSTHVLDCWPKDHYKNRIRKTIKQESWPREVLVLFGTLKLSGQSGTTKSKRVRISRLQLMDDTYLKAKSYTWQTNFYSEACKRIKISDQTKRKHWTALRGISESVREECRVIERNC